jgi:hypothetical protein
MKKKFFATMILLMIAFANLAYAQADTKAAVGPDTKASVNVKLENPFSTDSNSDLFDLFEAIVKNIILPIGGVLCVLAFIYVGFLFVMARGKEAELGKAKRALVYTSIGTALILGAWVIAELLQSTVNQLL